MLAKNSASLQSQIFSAAAFTSASSSSFFVFFFLILSHTPISHYRMGSLNGIYIPLTQSMHNSV